MGRPNHSTGSDAPAGTARSLTLPERYRVRRHIATGGMASVWCADDLVLGRSVAIKVLAERFVHDRVATQRFTREARAAARVSTHPHVVTIYDVGELARAPGADPLAPSRPFIVMEHLAGGTVADAIHHDLVRRHEALRWLHEAATALDHAHSRGIVHRDIKPANFLLDRGRVLHVADFGIARLTSEDTITTADELFGTAAYLSPEQALGRPATGASDRYALAVTAFELLLGRRPFSAPHFSAQARQHIEEPPPVASDLDRSIPPAVDEVLLEGLAKDPDARPASAGAFVAALTRSLSEPPAAGSKRGARRRPAVDPSAPAASTAAARAASRPAAGVPGDTQSGPPRRRRLAALGAIGAAIAVVAGIAVAGGGGSHSTRRPTPTAAAARPRPSPIDPARRPHAPRRAPRRAARTRPAHSAGPQLPVAVPSAAELQSTGHAEMLAANFQAAIPTLRRAVKASSPSSPTYAYALYDLGRSLVMSGQARQAIPVLEQRLKIPDQQSTVRDMLDQAYAAADDHAPADGAAAPTTTTTSTSPTTPTTPGTPPTSSTPTSPSGGAGISPSGNTATAGGSGSTTDSSPTTTPGPSTDTSPTTTPGPSTGTGPAAATGGRTPAAPPAPGPAFPRPGRGRGLTRLAAGG